MRFIYFLFVLINAVSLCYSEDAPQKNGDAHPQKNIPEEAVTSQHQITIEGKPLTTLLRLATIF